MQCHYCGWQEESAILIFRLLLRIHSMYIQWVASFTWTSTKNEWNVLQVIWSGAFAPSITCSLISHVLTIYHVKLMQRTAFQQKRFNLQSFLPTLCNPWLLLVNNYFLLSNLLNSSFQILQNKAYLVLMIAFGSGIGLFTCLTTLLEQVICPRGYNDVRFYRLNMLASDFFWLTKQVLFLNQKHKNPPVICMAMQMTSLCIDKRKVGTYSSRQHLTSLSVK